MTKTKKDIALALIDIVCGKTPYDALRRASFEQQVVPLAKASMDEPVTDEEFEQHVREFKREAPAFKRFLADLRLETLRLPRFDGHELSPKKGLNHDKEEGSRGNAPAV